MSSGAVLWPHCAKLLTPTLTPQEMMQVVCCYMHYINITTIISYTSHIAITSLLHHHYIVITLSLHLYTPLHFITSPLHHLHCHYSTITSPLHFITSPLHHHYITITSPLHYHYITITLPLHPYIFTICSCCSRWPTPCDCSLH